jgi:hypothetical protein
MSMLCRVADSMRSPYLILGLLVLIAQSSVVAAQNLNPSHPADARTKYKLVTATPMTGLQHLPPMRYVPGLEEPLVATGLAARQVSWTPKMRQLDKVEPCP